MYKAYENFLAIGVTTMYHITECVNKIQINNNNKILPPYIIDTFYLYYKQEENLLGNYGKIYKASQ